MSDLSIKENLFSINERIRYAELKAGRKEGSVKLLAVSKFHPSEAVMEAINCGQFLFGENRVQEAEKKFPGIIEKNPATELHMIGQLQTNKVKTAVKIAKCIESVDRIDLIKEIEKQCAKIEKTIDILLELHTGEESKSGFESIDELKKALDFISEGKCPHLKVSGLMTMAPFTKDETVIRKSFSTLKNLQQKLKEEYKNLSFDELSMGMSGDFELAILEGSTMVRVGTAIFGERQY